MLMMLADMEFQFQARWISAIALATFKAIRIYVVAYMPNDFGTLIEFKSAALNEGTPASMHPMEVIM